MAQAPPELLAHREWLGQIEPVGLVVSPNVLVRQGVFVDRQKSIEVQTKLAELVGDEEEARVSNAPAFFRQVVEWPESALAGTSSGPPIPDDLVAALPEYEDHIRATYAVADPDKADEWSILIQVTPTSDLDAKPAEGTASGWRASAHARLERLLRETGVAIGILFNGTSLRLVYAPRGESSGHLTFKFKYLLETQGRPMAGALAALLGVERVTDVGAPGQRLSLLLKESRKSQNDVSTALAGQVLEALWELVRGFQHANEASKGALLEHAMREAPNEVYGGLLTTLMRLVFVLYAEDRGLMPGGDVYQRHYSVAGLFQKLREDAARYPDTMDARYGAWAQLLALFRLIHDGGRHGNLHFTARHGRLFDPDAYPFLEGRPHGTFRSKGDRVDPPRVSDGVVFRILQNLLILDSERLSYRALDVEQIGSVYEAMMGFALEQAHGPSIAVSPKHIVVNMTDLLERKGSERAKWLREQAELKLTSADAISKAETADDVVAALGKKVSRYTPNALPVNALYLQPTEERRRSGSHYTPRSLTEPIVGTTFQPILERLGDEATPEQILDLKVCDPAMGSGAFLVEACRLLSERLVRAWELHKQTPKVPDDEDILTHARRLVAERCLYGVDKNIFAVDLAKLSLWLATLAREHPFTFLDHALRHGDSLVGLSREQIACFNWEVETQLPLLRSLIDERVREAQRLREQIQGLAISDDVPRKEQLLRDTEDALADVRLIGDVVISSFFEREKPKERKTLRTEYAGKLETWLRSEGVPSREARATLNDVAHGLREDVHPIPPFHWEIEFPEVFTRSYPGFDVFVGNPPFAGKNTLAAANREHYPVWLQALHEESHGNSDLVAHFYRRAFNLLRAGGAFGLIATNTIAQGDTRGTGLRWVTRHQGTIFAARKRIRWPGLAAVVVSVVHVSKGPLVGPFDLDGSAVSRITAFLFDRGGDDDPVCLTQNHDLAREGIKWRGEGFIVASHEARALIGRDHANAKVVKPLLIGEVLKNLPRIEPDRFIIDFTGLNEHQARAFEEPFAIVEERVRPDRMALPKTRDNARLREEWWLFERARSEFLARAGRTESCFAMCITGSRHAVAKISTTWLPANTVVVFLDDSWNFFALIQSTAHEMWARFFGSSMKDDPRYTPSRCFETFPLPERWRANRELERIGSAYYEFRAALMIQTGQGLTEVYNRFHNPKECAPEIENLRQLHIKLDREVLDAYGWRDIGGRYDFLLDYEFEDAEQTDATRPYRYRWPNEVGDEILSRLQELNGKRALMNGPRPPSKGDSRSGVLPPTRRPLLEERS